MDQLDRQPAAEPGYPGSDGCWFWDLFGMAGDNCEPQNETVYNAVYAQVVHADTGSWWETGIPGAGDELSTRTPFVFLATTTLGYNFSKPNARVYRVLNTMYCVEHLEGRDGAMLEYRIHASGDLEITNYNSWFSWGELSRRRTIGYFAQKGTPIIEQPETPTVTIALDDVPPDVQKMFNDIQKASTLQLIYRMPDDIRKAGCKYIYVDDASSLNETVNPLRVFLRVQLKGQYHVVCMDKRNWTGYLVSKVEQKKEFTEVTCEIDGYTNVAETNVDKARTFVCLDQASVTANAEHFSGGSVNWRSRRRSAKRQRSRRGASKRSRAR